MFVADDESVRRPEAVLYGDLTGKHQFWLQARFRTEVLAVGVLAVLVPTGHQLGQALFGWLPGLWSDAAAVVVGGGAGAILSVAAVRFYARHDKPWRRLDYHLQQAWALLSSPKAPPPPIDVVAARPLATPGAEQSGGIAWEVATPPPLSEHPREKAER